MAVFPDLDAMLVSLDAEACLRQLVFPALLPEPPGPLPEVVTWGGYILCTGSAAAISALTADVRRRAPVPLLIGADVEVGTAQTVFDGTLLPTAMALAATGDPTLIRQAAAHTAAECRALGIDWAFAPVADVNSQPDNPIINVRAFGDGAPAVAACVGAWIEACQAGGVMATAKHFPGHGDSRRDSHVELPVVDVSRQTLDERELVPFKAAIAAGVASIMTAHLGVPCLDDPGVPATLSPAIMTSLLRDELGFTGLLVTDAMIMGGVLALLPAGEAVVQAILAGCDVILAPPDPEAAYEALRQAMDEGRLTLERVRVSVRRILEAKARYCTDAASFPRWTGLLESGHWLARRIARQAVTRIGGLDLPVDVATATGIVVVDPWNVWQIWHQHLVDHGCRDIRRIGPGVMGADLIANTAALTGPVILSMAAVAAPWQGLPGWSPDLLDGIKALARRLPVHLVLLGTPYPAAQVPEAASVIGTYAYDHASQEAAIAALTGAMPASGRLPVRLQPS